MTTESENEIIRPAQPAQATHRAVPRIIPRSDHPVSRKNIDKEALKVLYRLRDAGYTAYLVGGGVRDLYLGKIPKDFDISTNARPGQVRKLFKNSRLIGRRFRLVQVFFRGNKIIEVATFRRRSEFDIKKGNNAGNEQDEVLPANNTYGTPVDDAFRRDLTINALFYETDTYSIIDYTGGVEDLDQGIIRLIGDPDRRITRDPVRMMRVIRHAARNNFTIEKNTWQAINNHRQELKLCPVSRIRDELLKDLRGGASLSWSRLAIDSGLFDVLFPFYETVLSSSAQKHNIREQLAHILSVIDRLHNESKQRFQLPEHILLTLILIPWAIAEMDIMEKNLKGAEAYRFSRTIRKKIDEILEHLNIKRSMKEIITILLVNLNHFQRHENRLPKWLKKKSFFMECKRIHQIYREVQGGSQVELSVISSLAAGPAFDSGKSRSKKSHRRSGRPAFAPGNSSGVFGFKKSRGKKK